MRIRITYSMLRANTRINTICGFQTRLNCPRVFFYFFHVDTLSRQDPIYLDIAPETVNPQVHRHCLHHCTGVTKDNYPSDNVQLLYSPDEIRDEEIFPHLKQEYQNLQLCPHFGVKMEEKYQSLEKEDHG
ncbi:hypothetical protein Tco_0164462 [Tanacetum coccineum]